MPLTEILFLSFAVGLAGFTQGLSGFGSSLVFVPLLSLFIDIKTVIPLGVLLSLSINTYLILNLWQHISWKQLFPTLVMIGLGIFPGVYFLKVADVAVLEILVGVILILFCIYGFFIKLPQKKVATGWKYLAGFLAGFLGGSISTNAPPLIIYATFQSWSKNSTKAFFAACFFVCGLGTLLLQASAGMMTEKVLLSFALALPILLLATALGHIYYGKLNEKLYRQVIFALLSLLGLAMLWQGMK